MSTKKKVPRSTARRTRRRRPTAAEQRRYKAQRAYWQWQTCFEKATDMLIKMKTPASRLARTAEKLANDLVAVDRKHRPEEVDL